MKRLDVLMVESALVSSRNEAQRAIAAGLVTVEGVVTLKPSRQCSGQSNVQFNAPHTVYVGRGGDKLAAALNSFGIDPSGATCLDIGISTGGFTDCLLQRGASKVVGVDVGHGQLHPIIAADARVELREGVNARGLTPADFADRFSVIVVDLSFISLRLVLPVVPALMDVGAHLICLIKPQFEVGQGRLGKRGIVTDPQLRLSARDDVHCAADRQALVLAESIESPIAGGDGNVEFLSYFKRAGD